MTEEEIFKQTKDVYLELIHPGSEDLRFSRNIASLINMASSVSDEIVITMIAGSSWRERLLGLAMAMTKQKQPASYIESMFQSLRDPRCLAIVPAAAALALLARRGVFAMAPSFDEEFDDEMFSGEVGWAVKKAMCLAGLRPDNAAGIAPNSGQVFEDHIQFYDYIRAK